MTEIYIIMHGVEKVDTDNLLPLNIRTQGQPMELIGNRFGAEKEIIFY